MRMLRRNLVGKNRGRIDKHDDGNDDGRDQTQRQKGDEVAFASACRPGAADSRDVSASKMLRKFKAFNKLCHQTALCLFAKLRLSAGELGLLLGAQLVAFGRYPLHAVAELVVLQNRARQLSAQFRRQPKPTRAVINISIRNRFSIRLNIFACYLASDFEVDHFAHDQNAGHHPRAAAIQA